MGDPLSGVYRESCNYETAWVNICSDPGFRQKSTTVCRLVCSNNEGMLNQNINLRASDHILLLLELDPAIFRPTH